MAKQFDQISEELQGFIHRQHLFFVGTAAEDGRVNVSPKGMDSLRVTSPNTVIWVNLTGSGNETAAHLLRVNRLTLMFCSFEGKPLILRLYGHAKMHHRGEPGFRQYIQLFPDLPGARQVVEVTVEMVQTSCGYAVPFMDFREERTQLNQWAEKQGEERLVQYRQKKNVQSIDGFETGLL